MRVDLGHDVERNVVLCGRMVDRARAILGEEDYGEGRLAHASAALRQADTYLRAAHTATMSQRTQLGTVGQALASQEKRHLDIMKAMTTVCRSGRPKSVTEDSSGQEEQE